MSFIYVPAKAAARPIFFLAFFLFLSTAKAPGGAIQYQAVGTRAMISSAHSLATMAGIEILRQGGTAFDAAVAVSATLNVVEPSRSGIGGVGFMTLYIAKTGEVLSLQMTGAAPYAATPDKFSSKRDQEAGYLSGVVPGNFGGWVYLLERYGTMSLDQVFKTAIDYAENGFPVDSYLAETLEDVKSTLEIFPETAEVYLPQGKLPQNGQRLIQAGLAGTFRRLAAAEQEARKSGKSRKDALQAAYDLFYRGEIAREFVAFYQENGGLFSARDFADYRPVWTRPVHTRYKDYDVYSSGLPSRGGIQTVMVLNLLESFDLKSLGHNSPSYLHLLSEAIKLVNADVYRYLGDPKFVQSPLEGMLSKEYATERRSKISLDKSSPYAAAGNPASTGKGTESFPPAGALNPADRNSPLPAEFSYRDDIHTTHFDIIDPAGNAVSCTPTIGTFGTKVVVGKTGIIFHNATRFGSFSPYRGDANFIDGGKTSLLNNSPMIAMKNGKLFMVWGTPGGEGIGQTQFQVFLDVVEFGMGIQEAIEAPRMELRAKPDFYKAGADVSIGFENRIAADTRQALVEKGNRIRMDEQPFAQVFGGMQGILIHPEFGTLLGGADPRRGGCALGY